MVMGWTAALSPAHSAPCARGITFPSGGDPANPFGQGDLPDHRRHVRLPAVRWEQGDALDNVAEGRLSALPCAIT